MSGSANDAQADGRVEAVPRAAQSPEELDELGIPAGDVEGDLLEDGQRPLAPPVVDRLGHVQPLAASVEVGHQVGRQQVADVRDDPVVAGLDRLVFPHPVDAAPQRRGLGADPVHQLAQRSIGIELVRVERAIDRRQQVPQLVGVVGLVVVLVVDHEAASRPMVRCWSSSGRNR